jgi:hypothetical protein
MSTVTSDKTWKQGGITVDSKSGTVIEFCGAVVWRRQQRDITIMYMYVYMYIFMYVYQDPAL